MSIDGFGLARDEIRKDIVSALDRSGLLYREFSRLKSEISLQKKLKKDPGKYTAVSGKKIQDIIGIRIVLYFQNDIAIAKEIIGKLFKERVEDSSITLPDLETFAPNRFNLIYEIPHLLHSVLPNYESSIGSYLVASCNHFVLDYTFEIQLRTVLSEGWHEVEHDLRYKFPTDWSKQDIESRAFNGIYATLETAEWSMNKIIDQLAYHHYKESNINALIRSIFKLRFDSSSLSSDLEGYLSSNKTILKKFLRIDREDFIIKRMELKFQPPLNYNNIVYLANLFYIKDDNITQMTPKPIRDLIPRDVSLIQ